MKKIIIDTDPGIDDAIAILLALAAREELEDMVFEINRTQVLPEDVLSDQVYLYERECHRLSAGSPGGRKTVDN